MSDWFEKVYQCAVPNSPKENCSKRAQIGLMPLIFFPFAQLIDRFGSWCKIAGIYALILSIISFAFGYGYVCSYNGYDAFFYCGKSVWAYGIYTLIKFIIWGFFIAEWIDFCHSEKFQLAQVGKISINKVKTAIMLLALLASFGVGCLAGYLLIIRVPNPNWKIELGYFTIVSTIFLVPIMATRFYGLIAISAKGKIFPSMLQVWKATSGQVMKILFALFVLLVLLIFVIGNYSLSFRYNGNGNPVIFSLISEFGFEMIILLFLALFAGHCTILAEVIEGAEKNE